MAGLHYRWTLSPLNTAQPKAEGIERNLVINGAGPSGLTAGLYAGRAQLEALIMLARRSAGRRPTTEEMEN
jgi:ribulose 1,5-bisphosphate synthetase/thiazole synthase